MKRKIIGLAALLCVAASAVHGHKDQGHYVSRMVEKLPEFHAVHVQGNIEVDFMQHPTHTAHASGPQRVLDQAVIRVENGVLHVGFLPQSKLQRGSTLRVMVTGPALHEVTVSGKGEVHVRGKLQVQDLHLVLMQEGDFSADGVAVHTLDIHAADRSEVDINGVDAHHVKAVADGQADIELAGLALKARLENHGSGELDAADLRVQHGEAVLNGKGDIAVSAYEALSARAFGKGKIKYRGTPVALERQGNVKHIVQDKED